MNSNSHSNKYGNSSGNSGGHHNRSSSGGAKDGGSSGEDGDSELIDMTDNEEENDSDCESFDSGSRYSKEHISEHQRMKTKDQTSEAHANRGSMEAMELDSPKGAQQPPVVPSPVKQMAQHFGQFGELAGAFSLPNLAMSMFLPPNGGTEASNSTSPPVLGGANHVGSFLDAFGGDHHQHAHYLNALHAQQQQQFQLFNSSLKLGALEHHHALSHAHHHHSASAASAVSAFRKVK